MKKRPILLISVLIIGLFIVVSFIPNVLTRIARADYTVTIQDDYSFPQWGDYDYLLSNQDISFITDNPLVGDTITITADIQNYGFCMAIGGWGWYSSNGRSCWAEWDFNYPTTGTVDISYRCHDDVTVDWRVELDGTHLSSPSVPGVGSNNHWKIVTIEDVSITTGSHTLFLGTYQMDYDPDYCLDWVKIGDLQIEAETYDRMGGNDPNADLRGVYIEPQDIKVQVWEGNPLIDGVLLYENFVGNTNTVVDFHHEYTENTYTAHYIENNGIGQISCDYIIQSPNDEIYVLIDPNNVLNEVNESNNIASRKIMFMDINQSIRDHGFPIRHTLDGDWGGAQNFTPTVNTVPMLEIYIRKMGTPEFDLTVELREDGLQGILLDTVVIPIADVPTSWAWLTVDFADKMVGVGSDVFIVLPPAPIIDITTYYGYEWGYALGNQYNGGSFWFTRNGGLLWRDLPTMYEFCLRTYGYL